MRGRRCEMDSLGDSIIKLLCRGTITAFIGQSITPEISSINSTVVGRRSSGTDIMTSIYKYSLSSNSSLSKV